MRSLQATLPAIIFIRYVCVAAGAEQRQEGAGVRERYEMYKNTATYKQLEYEMMYENATRCT